MDGKKPGHVQANCQRCKSTATSSSEATQQCIESFGRTFCDVKIWRLLLIIPYAPWDCKFTYEFTLKINHTCRYIDVPHMEHVGMFFYNPEKVTAGTHKLVVCRCFFFSNSGIFWFHVSFRQCSRSNYLIEWILTRQTYKESPLLDYPFLLTLAPHCSRF